MLQGLKTCKGICGAMVGSLNRGPKMLAVNTVRQTVALLSGQERKHVRRRQVHESQEVDGVGLPRQNMFGSPRLGIVFTLYSQPSSHVGRSAKSLGGCRPREARRQRLACQRGCTSMCPTLTCQAVKLATEQ